VSGAARPGPLQDSSRAKIWLSHYWPYLLVAVIGTCGAFVQISSQFSPWDDEGYLVSSVSEFLRGGSLYDQIYTQYGPF